MLGLFLKFTKWITRRAALLLTILLVLMAAAWIQATWEEINQKTKTIDQLEILHTTKSKLLDDLTEELKQKAPEIAKTIEDARSLCDVATFWLREVSEAGTQLELLKNRCGGFRKVCSIINLEEVAAAQIEVATKRAKYRSAQKACNAAKQARDISGELERKIVALVQDTASLEEEIRTLKESVSRTPMHRMILAVQEQIIPALIIFFGILLTPYLIRTFLYFLLAPLVRRMAPVHVLTASAGTPSPGVSSSSESVVIGHGQELVIHQDCLLSKPENLKTGTRWLLNRHLPFSSLASGMYALTALENTTGAAKPVQVAATKKNAHDEVMSIELPTGSAMVIKPSSLIGILKPIDQEIAITRHWRIFCIHSWMTLQLRYLVLHGPCKIIVRGCRGVRVGSPTTDSSQLLIHTTTIGFSANIGYSNQRCEPFFPFLRGAEDLFRDSFRGESGVFIYSVTTDKNQNSGPAGRPLEWIADTTLNIFGL